MTALAETADAPAMRREPSPARPTVMGVPETVATAASSMVARPTEPRSLPMRMPLVVWSLELRISRSASPVRPMVKLPALVQEDSATLEPMTRATVVPPGWKPRATPVVVMAESVEWISALPPNRPTWRKAKLFQVAPLRVREAIALAAPPNEPPLWERRAPLERLIEPFEEGPWRGRGRWWW